MFGIWIKSIGIDVYNIVVDKMTGLNKKGIRSFLKSIKNKKEVDSYHTGLVGEKLIVASYESMSIEKLEALRFILNGIIKKKKEAKRGWNDGNKKLCLQDKKKDK